MYEIVLVLVAPAWPERVHMWALFPSSFLPASINLAGLQISHWVPHPGIVRIKSSHLGWSAIGSIHRNQLTNLEQLLTFASNCAPKGSKLKYMSLIIIPQLWSKDNVGKVGPNSRSWKSWFLDASVMFMLVPRSDSIPWCSIRATHWIANSPRMNLPSLIQARDVLVSF